MFDAGCRVIVALRRDEGKKQNARGTRRDTGDNVTRIGVGVLLSEPFVKLHYISHTSSYFLHRFVAYWSQIWRRQDGPLGSAVTCLLKPNVRR